MPDVTPAQQFPFPTETDDPDVPGDMESLALAVERRVMGVYNSAADRDAKIPAPQTGQFAYLIDTNTITVWQGAIWQDYPEQEDESGNPLYPKTHYGTTAPSSSLGANGDIYFRI